MKIYVGISTLAYTTMVSNQRYANWIHNNNINTRATTTTQEPLKQRQISASVSVCYNLIRPVSTEITVQYHPNFAGRIFASTRFNNANNHQLTALPFHRNKNDAAEEKEGSARWFTPENSWSQYNPIAALQPNKEEALHRWKAYGWGRNG